MALFEFDEGRLIPAQFGRPVERTLEPEILDSVRAQVLEVISRPLFPVTWEDAPQAGAEQGEPRLTALDPSGQIVTVEVVQVLNSAALIASLGRMGRVARLGWLDLAAAYPGGPDAFRSAWSEFRESMPTTGESGPSLVIVAAKIEDSVRTVVDVLAASGLEVQEITVREMSNGRKFLDVRPVGGRTFGSGNVLPSSEEPTAIGVGETEFNTDLTADEDEVAPEPEFPFFEEEIEVPVESYEVPVCDFQDGEIAEVADESKVLDEVDTQAEQVSAATAEVAAVADVDLEDAEVVAFGADEAVGEVVTDCAVDEAVPVPESQILAEADSPQTAEPVVETALKHDAQGLETLGAVLDQDTILLCPRPDLGSAEAVLTAQGEIRCADATLTRDVAESLLHSGIEVHGDGWEQWHIGLADGPTLAEAIDEVNQELTRRELHERA